MAPSTARSRRRYYTKSSRPDGFLRACLFITPPSSPDRTPRTKKPRLTSRDDILKQLAQNAIDEMRLQGLIDQTQAKQHTDHNSAIRLQENYDPLVINSSQIEDDEDDLCKPQSPLSFFNRVGLRDTTKSRHDNDKIVPPPPTPPIIDAKTPSHSRTTSPSSCASPESNLFGRYSHESLRDVTPATAHAARCLLELRR